MADVSITEALRADQRVIDALVARTRGSIAGLLTADELRSFGYDVPDGYKLRAWPFEFRQGRDGFLAWAANPNRDVAGGISTTPRPVLFTDAWSKSDWIIFGAAASVLGLGIAGLAGVGPLAGSAGATTSAAAAATASAPAATAVTTGGVVATVAGLTPTAAAIATALRSPGATTPAASTVPSSGWQLTSTQLGLIVLVLGFVLFKR